MHQSYIIGLDLGTGSTKAVAVAPSGTVLFTHQQFYPEHKSHSEQDPSLVWEAFVVCIQQVVHRLQDPPEAVVLSSAMHSIMAVNEAGQPLTPIITWADNRASGIAAALAATPLGKQLYEGCGTPIHALSPLCKIAWWQQNDPAVFSAAHIFIGIKEWVWYRLFNQFEIDYSLACATGMLELNSLQWSAPALHFAGIKPAQLSRPVPTSFIRKALPAVVAKMLHLPPATPFVIGASDGCLANLGTGALINGIGAVTVGTSGAVRIACSEPQPQWPAQLFNYYLHEGIWITGGAINNGGAAISWIADLLFTEGVQDAPFSDLNNIAPGANGLMFLPFLLGERAPIWDSRSSAAFIGLGQQHGKAHLLKAVVEGVCFALRSVLDPLEKATGSIKKLHLSGGFSRSEEALQMFADCTGKEVVRLQTADASAIGAAYLGFMAMGWIKDFSELPMPTETDRFLPHAGKLEQYNELFRIYLGLYPTLKDTMHRLQAFAAKEV
jgi:gluconokinase